jgi:hypothetical protein
MHVLLVHGAFDAGQLGFGDEQEKEVWFYNALQRGI